MEEHLKYFVPEISDIRVGYECEYNPTGDLWVKALLNKNSDFSFLFSKPIRTLYLTKEQIEAEGWKFIKHNKDINLLAFRININEHSWYELDYYIDSKTLLIDKYYCNGDYNLGLFNGECKSINELRLIQKMLHV